MIDSLNPVKAAVKGGPLHRELQVVNYVDELQYLQAFPTPTEILDSFDHYIYRAVGFHPTGTNASLVDSEFYVSPDDQLANLKNTGAVNLLVAPPTYPSNYQSMRLASLNGDDDFMGWVIAKKETLTELSFLIAYVDLQPTTGAKFALMVQTVDKALVLPNAVYTEDHMPEYVLSQTTLHSQIYPALGGASHTAEPPGQGWLTPPWPDGLGVVSTFQKGNLDIKWYHPQTKALVDHWVFQEEALPALKDMVPCAGLMNCSQIEGRWYDYLTAFASPDVYVIETDTIWRLNVVDREYEDTGGFDTPFLTRGRYGESTQSPVGHQVYRNGWTGAFEITQYPTMLELELEFTEAGTFSPVFTNPVGVNIDWGNGETTVPDTDSEGRVRYNMSYEPGTYKVVIKGRAQNAEVASVGLRAVTHWGEGTFEGIAFYRSGGEGNPAVSSPHLVSVPIFLPRSVKNLNQMFRGCTDFNQPLLWDWRNVESAIELLRDCVNYDHPLDLSQATNLVGAAGLLQGASKFNSLLNLKGTKVRTFNYLLSGATAYNQGTDIVEPQYAEQAISMFEGCTNLEIPGFTITLPLTTSIMNMFRRCPKLTGQVTIKGTALLKNIDGAFEDCTGLVTCPVIEDAGEVVGATRYLAGCSSLTTFVAPGTLVPMTKLQDISYLVARCRVLNVPVNLPTATTRKMEFVFDGCWAFDQLITFDVTEVDSFMGFLQGCESYDKPIDFRAATKVRNISRMLAGCHQFNSLIQMSTTNVTNASAFLQQGRSYTLPPPDFDLSNVETLAYFLEGCALFDHPISYVTPKLTNCMSLLAGCSIFNNTISLTTLLVTNMSYMMQGCTNYNTEFTLYTGKVTTFSRFMMSCRDYNKPLNLDTSSATNMARMLYLMPNLNQPLPFDVSNVTDMMEMLSGDIAFDQDLSHWCVTKIPTKPTGFDDNTPSWVKPKPIWGTCPV